MNTKNLALALLACAALGTAPSVMAAESLITTRAGLGGNDFIDWGTLGGPFTQLTTPFNVLSNGGRSVTVNESAGDGMGLLQQGNGWGGNFAPGDNLLWTETFTDNANPVSLSGFGGNPIFGGGAQIQADFFGAYTAKIEAFDAGNNSLGSFTASGDSNSNGDNSAIFIGILGSAPIARLEFSLTSASFDIADFAINRFDFVTTGTVPEPGSLAVFGAGLVGTALARRRKKA